MEYQHFRNTNTGQRTAAIFTGDPIIDVQANVEGRASRLAGIAASLGWHIDDTESVITNTDPGPGDVVPLDDPPPITVDPAITIVLDKADRDVTATEQRAAFLADLRARHGGSS
jgi:hypothetical protein